MNDEVDAIIDGWARQRPDLDIEPLAIFSRFLRLDRHLERMRKETFANHALESWEFEMLAALRRQSEHRLTAGQLMKETQVSSGTITNRLDRMQVKGLLVRKADDSDGRVVHVHATEEGIARVDRAMDELVARENAMLSKFAPAEKEQAAAFLRHLLVDFEKKATACD